MILTSWISTKKGMPVTIGVFFAALVVIAAAWFWWGVELFGPDENSVRPRPQGAALESRTGTVSDTTEDGLTISAFDTTTHTMVSHTYRVDEETHFYRTLPGTARRERLEDFSLADITPGTAVAVFTFKRAAPEREMVAVDIHIYDE